MTNREATQMAKCLRQSQCWEYNDAAVDAFKSVLQDLVQHVADEVVERLVDALERYSLSTEDHAATDETSQTELGVASFELSNMLKQCGEDVRKTAPAAQHTATDVAPTELGGASGELSNMLKQCVEDVRKAVTGSCLPYRARLDRRYGNLLLHAEVMLLQSSTDQETTMPALAAFQAIATGTKCWHVFLENRMPCSAYSGSTGGWGLHCRGWAERAEEEG